MKKKIPIQARASFWFLACGVLQSGLNIITLPIFTRILTTEQYGLSSSYFAWYDVVGIICTLRFSYGVFDKGMIVYRNEKDKFESALLGLSITISSIVLLFFLMFHSWFEFIFDMSFTLCLSMIICQMVSPALLFWTNRSKFDYKYKSFSIITIFTSVVCVTINLLTVLYCPGDKGIIKILSYQSVWALTNFLVTIYIFIKGKLFYRKDIWKYALSYNIPLLPYFLSTLILDKSDRVMISEICGKSAVALYSVSYSLANLMILFTSAIGGAFTPWIYRKIDEKDYKSIPQVCMAILIVFFALAFVFMMIAPELIRFFAPEDYYGAIYVIPPVVASNFFILMYSLISRIEYYFESTKIVAAISIITGIINIVMNYLCIPKWGYVVAAYTTLISYIVSTLLHCISARYICICKKIEGNVFPWRKMIGLSISMLLVTFLVNYIYPYFLLRIVIIVFVVASFVRFRKKIVDLTNNLEN